MRPFCFAGTLAALLLLLVDPAAESGLSLLLVARHLEWGGRVEVGISVEQVEGRRRKGELAEPEF